MPDSFTQTGTAIVVSCPAIGDTPEVGLCIPAVPLWMYAEAIGYGECGFFGVIRPDPPKVHANKPLWIKSERNQVEFYLLEAQQEIEQVIGYPLMPCWIEGEEHDYIDPLRTRWSKVIEAGVQAVETIASGAAVDHTNDPAVVGPFVDSTSATEGEIRVFHPGSDVEIFPSEITISGNTITLEIPRCRMLTEDADIEGAIDYEDTGVGGSFELTVDVMRVYTDPSTQAVLRWTHGTGTCPTCTGTTDDACMVITDAEIGELDVSPATYSGGAWSRSNWNCYCHLPDRVQLNYRAGLTTLTAQARTAIIRLAHAKMPHNPCNVDPPLWMWSRDRDVPAGLTRARINCPWGLEQGAWTAYQFAMSMRTVRGSVL